MISGYKRFHVDEYLLVKSKKIIILFCFSYHALTFTLGKGLNWIIHVIKKTFFFKVYIDDQNSQADMWLQWSHKLFYVSRAIEQNFWIKQSISFLISENFSIIQSQMLHICIPLFILKLLFAIRSLSLNYLMVYYTFIFISPLMHDNNFWIIIYLSSHLNVLYNLLIILPVKILQWGSIFISTHSHWKPKRWRFLSQ